MIAFGCADNRHVAQNSWKLLPLAGGGCMTGVEISPSCPDIWYAYADVGGPYRSDDAGHTWKALHSNFTVAQREDNADHVRGLLIDPENPDRILLVAGWRIHYHSAGAYLSTDGGKSFKRTLKAKFAGEGSLNKHCGKVLVRHPENKSCILAASVGEGIFRSIDGGETWMKCGAEGYEFTSLAFDLSTPGRVFAAAPRCGELTGKTSRFGLLRSDDGGLSWKNLEGAEAPIELVHAPGEAAIIGIFRRDGKSEIRKSSDGGMTWHDYHQGLPSSATVKDFGVWYSHPYEFLALAAGPDFLAACNWDGDLFIRRKDDSKWRQIPLDGLRQGNPATEHYLRKNNLELKKRCCTCSITIDPSNPGHLLTTDWYDLWETRDGGRNWVTRIDIINQVVPFTVSCDPSSVSNIVYGLADHVSVYSHDGGKKFSASCNGPVDLTEFAWSSKIPGRIYGVGGKGAWSIVISDDAGKTWRYSSYKGIAASRWLKDGGGVFSVAVDPVTDDVYVCRGGEIAPGKGGVYRSSDGGITWKWFSNGIEPAKDFFRNHEFQGGGAASWAEQIVFSPDGSALMGGRGTREMYRLDRTAERWVKLSQRYSVTEYTFAADPFVPGRFLIATARGIDEYVDGGKTFKGTLPGSESLGYALAFDRHNPGLIASMTADRENIVMSRDGGRRWAILPDGMKVPTGTYHRLVLDRGRLYIHTRGSGVWTRNAATGNRR